MPSRRQNSLPLWPLCCQNLTFAQLWYVVKMRSEISHLIDNEITRNYWIWAAIALCAALILTAIYSPVLSLILQLEKPGAIGWAIILQ